jgi:V/A-type H+-transporting ATPase subunit B
MRLDGPLLFMRRTLEVGLNEAVIVTGRDGAARLGRIAAIDDDLVTIEMLEPTAGLGLADTVVRFLGEPIEFGVGPGVLGQVFNGIGQVIDGGPPLAVDKRLRIDGIPLNPVARATPRAFIESGVTAVDLMNSLVRGQKLPIFSGGGLPHDRIAVEIAGNARLRGTEASEFAIVFAGIGVPYTTAEYFRRSLEQSGALERSALFLNLASDSSTQRLLTPRFALTAAEYLALAGTFWSSSPTSPTTARRCARSPEPRGKCRAARAIRATCTRISPRCTSAPACWPTTPAASHNFPF